MDYNYKTVRQEILDHCSESGVLFDDFCDIWISKVNDDPTVFDIFFEAPFSEISEIAKNARVELLIDVFTI
jgi:hypothetical protein